MPNLHIGQWCKMPQSSVSWKPILVILICFDEYCQDNRGQFPHVVLVLISPRPDFLHDQPCSGWNHVHVVATGAPDVIQVSVHEAKFVKTRLSSWTTRSRLHR